MKGDNTRDTFRPAQRYRTVRFQQGRVPLDAELNEAQDLGWRRVETQAFDVIGPAGGPVDNAGFAVEVQGGELVATAGRYYVDGILCELFADTALTEQPDLPGYGLETDDGVYLAYLDVSFGHVSALEDPELREVALLGPDTTTRQRVLAQVRLLQVATDPEASIECADQLSAWDELVAPPTGALAARAEPEGTPANECSLTPGAGYRRLENQLYRVEIHAAGDESDATFKWSRDNASIASTWISQDGTKLVVGQNTRDPVRAFAPGQWIELIDLERELDGRPGTLVRLVDVREDVLELDPTTATDTVDWADFQTKPRVRRWDSAGVFALDEDADSEGYVPLEDGVQVRFEAGTYAQGDYWLIPARTVTGDVEWPLDEATEEPLALARHGVVHHYARLGLVALDDGVWSFLRDCRRLFAPLGHGASCCTIVVGDGVESHGDFDNLDQALAHLPDEGGTICMMAGTHEVAQDIVGRRRITITGCGKHTRLRPPAGSKSPSVLSFTDCRDIRLAGLKIEHPAGYGVVARGLEWQAARGLEVEGCGIVGARGGLVVDRLRDVSIRDSEVRVKDGPKGGPALTLRAIDAVVEHCTITTSSSGKGQEGQQRPAWGGLHLRGGCARVRVIDNRITGAAGHGISVGGSLRVLDEALDSDGDDASTGKDELVIEVSKRRAPIKVVDAKGESVAGVPLALFGDKDSAFALTDEEGMVWADVSKGSVEVIAGGGKQAEGARRREDQTIEIVVVEKALPEGVYYPDEIGPEGTEDSGADDGPRQEIGAAADDLMPLARIEITDNIIRNVGLCGIGALPLVVVSTKSKEMIAASATSLDPDSVGATVHELTADPAGPKRVHVDDLIVANNLIEHVFEGGSAPVLAALGGVAGGLSLPSARAASVRDNRIREYGDPKPKPACGLHFAQVRGVEVVGNEILAAVPVARKGVEAVAGHRGGIVFGLAMNRLATVPAADESELAGPWTITIRDNAISSTVGRALTMAAMGSVSVRDNVLESDSTGSALLDAFAGNVLILNLGGLGELIRLLAMGVGSTADKEDEDLNATKRVGEEFRVIEEVDADEAASIETYKPTLQSDVALSSVPALPSSVIALMFGMGTEVRGNRMRLGARNTAFAGQMIMGLGDVRYAGNHSASIQSHTLVGHAGVIGTTVRAVDNRWIEAYGGPGFSAGVYSFGDGMTAHNQADHCIIAESKGLAGTSAVIVDNQVLDRVTCKKLTKQADVKLVEGLSLSALATMDGGKRRPGPAKVQRVKKNVRETLEGGHELLVSAGLEGAKRGLVAAALADENRARVVGAVLDGELAKAHARAVPAAKRVDELGVLEVNKRAATGLASLTNERATPEDLVIEGALEMGTLAGEAGWGVALASAEGESLGSTETAEGGVFRLVVPGEEVERLGLGACDDLHLRISDSAGNLVRKTEAPLAAKAGADLRATVRLEPQPRILERKPPSVGDVPGVTKAIRRRLRAAGLDDLRKLSGARTKKLDPLLGSRLSAVEVRRAARQLLRDAERDED